MDYRQSSYSGRAYQGSKMQKSRKKKKRTSNIPFVILALIAVTVMVVMLLKYNSADSAKKDFESRYAEAKNQYDDASAALKAAENEKSILEEEIDMLQLRKIALGK